MRWRPFILLPVALLTYGCSVNGSFLETRGELDKSIYYYEQDSRGNDISISEKKEKFDVKKKGQPVRVPHPALVDIDSQIRINMVKHEGVLARPTEALLEEKKKIQAALLELEKVVIARQNLLDVLQDDNDETFRKAQEKAEEIEFRFIVKLIGNEETVGLWPEGTDEYDLLSDPDEKVSIFDPPSFTKLQQFLQKKIATIEAEDQAIAEEVRDRQITLRLEAFLSSPDPGKDPIPIHLEGYDSIRQGEFQRHDRSGIDLSEAERNKLLLQIKATNEVADVAERVRKKEISVQDAVWKASPIVSPKLGELLQEIKAFYPKIKKEQLEERLNNTKMIIREFVIEVHRKGKNLEKDFKDELNKMPLELGKFAVRELKVNPLINALRDAENFLSRAKDLHQRWESARRMNRAVLIEDSVMLLIELDKGFKETKKGIRETKKRIRVFVVNEEGLDKLKADIKNVLERFLQEKFVGLEADVRNSWLEVVSDPKGQALKEDLESYFNDARHVLKIYKGIVQALNLFNKSVKVGTRAPESLDIPLGKVKDTFIDLNYTPRLVGDTVTVRATLSRGDKENTKEIDTTTASFRIKQFGYFAKLSPAVVLVKPTKLKGGSDDFRFSPILSWMHHYAPRPDEQDCGMPILRALKAGIGIHSALLHFDGSDSDSVQLGLGGTVSFWENRLQFGGGVNLMADGDDDGLIYYFVGTDLIGILQTLQTTTGIGK